MKIYLACYDIEDDRTRDRVSKLMGEYGQRIQKSVFELRLRNETELGDLKKRLRDLSEDSLDIRFYHLCANCRELCVTLAGQRVASFPAIIIV